MLLARRMRFPSPRIRLVTAAGSTVALAVALSACGATEQLTAGMRAESAVDKLGEQPAASLVASVDASPDEAGEFLEKTHGSAPSPRAARLLAEAEVALAVGSGDGTPLREMRRSDAMNVASAVNFGGKDVFAVKSVQDKLFVRADPKALAKQVEASAENRDKAEKAVALADDLPVSLGSARDALEGEWIELDPEAFDDFARAADELSDQGDRSGRDPASGAIDESGKSRELKEAVEIASTLNGQSQREFVKRVETLLKKHAEFRNGGEEDGAEHVKVTLPGREAAKDLTAALRPLRIDIDPSRVPDRNIGADLEIRRGQLTELTIDLGQFTGDHSERSGSGERTGQAAGNGAHLPLRLEFGSGAAVSVEPPNGAKELRPEDMMAAIMYGALGTADF